MESGFAYLHPRNLVEKIPPGLDLEYSSIPFSIWRPCLPFLERRIPPVGPRAWLFRLTRIAWVFASLPTWFGFVLMMEVVNPPSSPSIFDNTVLPRRKGWTLWQRLTYPVLSRLIWAITFGLPPAASPVSERGIPPLARLWYGRGTEMQPVNVSFANKQEEQKWVQDEAVDPAGRIMPQGYLAAFWIRSKVALQSTPRETGLQVVLYLVGGGYITGHPLEASRVFDIARMTSIPVLGVNYRKAVTYNRSFPAALQDTISAYAYLVREGYTRIAVAGDSAGAGLALALMQYLSRMTEKEESERPEKLVMPMAAMFYSPWADLTVSHDYGDRVNFDIIHPTMTNQAIAAYTSNLKAYKTGTAKSDSEGIAALGRAHPFFSTALKSSLASLNRVKAASAPLQQAAPRFLIFYGQAELFAAEDAALCDNLRVAGLEVEEYVEEDEMHGFLLVPTFMSARVQPALDRMAEYLTSF